MLTAIALTFALLTARGPDSPPPVATSSSASKPITIRWLPASVTRFADEIATIAAHAEVPADLVAIITLVESQGDPAAASPTGALGLMQLMPETAAKTARAHGYAAPTRAMLLDPRYNLELGATHLANLIAQLAPDGDPRTLDEHTVGLVAAAYNGGLEHALAFAGGAPLRPETARYRAIVMQLWRARGERLRPPLR